MNNQSAHKPVGLFLRLAAIFYDLLLLTAVLFIATALLLPVTQGEAIKPGNPFYALYLVGVCFIYFGWFWTHSGQTLGMKTWRIKVCRFDGGPLTWQHALLRFVGAIMSWLPLGLGFFWSLFSKDKTTWHDDMSRTILVSLRD